jgi:hypothetical protein
MVQQKAGRWADSIGMIVADGILKAQRKAPPVVFLREQLMGWQMAQQKAWRWAGGWATETNRWGNQRVGAMVSGGARPQRKDSGNTWGY